MQVITSQLGFLGDAPLEVVTPPVPILDWSATPNTPVRLPGYKPTPLLDLHERYLRWIMPILGLKTDGFGAMIPGFAIDVVTITGLGALGLYFMFRK